MIVTPSGRSRTASSTSPRCSSSESVDASPVVPQTTKPSEPLAARWCISETNASSSTRSRSSNGVTIAVRIEPRSAMRAQYLRRAGHRAGRLSARADRGRGRRLTGGCALGRRRREASGACRIALAAAAREGGRGRNGEQQGGGQAAQRKLLPRMLPRAPARDHPPKVSSGSTLEEQVLEPDDGRALEPADAAHGEQHPGHERLALERVVADRQRLADVAEDHLLVGDEPRQPDRMDRRRRATARRAPSAPRCAPRSRSARRACRRGGAR